LSNQVSMRKIYSYSCISESNHYERTMKKVLTLILFTLFGFLIIQFLLTEKAKNQERFFAKTVQPLIDDLSFFDQLDTSYLDVSYDTLDAETQKDPSSLISSLKEQFRNNVNAYHISNPWELPWELDIEELISSMTLEQKVAQLFLFGFDGTLLSPGEKSFLDTYQPGGVIVM